VASDFVVRRAIEWDAPAVAALTDAAYAKYVPRIGRKPRPMTADYRQMIAEHAVWLLCRGDELAGVLVLMSEPDALLIYSVAVSPEHQHRGLGRRMLALAEEQARLASYARLRLYTNVHMTENIALYRRLGYAETGREEVSGTTLVHMAKPLAIA